MRFRYLSNISLTVTPTIGVAPEVSCGIHTDLSDRKAMFTGMTMRMGTLAYRDHAKLLWQAKLIK